MPATFLRTAQICCELKEAELGSLMVLRDVGCEGLVQLINVIVTLGDSSTEEGRTNV